MVVMPSGKSSMRWPTAGSMRGGHVFEPTSQWVPAIDGSGGSVLPTPVVNDMGANKTLAWWDAWAPNQKAADGRHAPHGKSLSIEVRQLLPTPGGERLLPTPTSRDHKDTGKMDYQRQADRSILPGVIMVQRSNDGGTSSGG